MTKKVFLFMCFLQFTALSGTTAALDRLLFVDKEDEKQSIPYFSQKD
ncbi:MAG: hypothetical protein NC206_08745 [Bacteroides sp.]|nr:hypothetical protein [Roseburia sp.]MCM1347158.1 hypothetical protein [Bacteroides sp.]MCM1421009.1 hypothetical protein [Bacteroides sp.]